MRIVRLTLCCLTTIAACARSPDRLLGSHTANVLSISWSPDGHYLATSAWDSTVRIWNVFQPDSTVVLRPEAPPAYRVEWNSSDSRLAMVTESSVQFWDTRTKTATQIIRLEPHNGIWMQVAWSHDGRSAAVYGWGDGTLHVQSADGHGRPTVLSGHTGGQVATADWSADDKLLLSGGAVGDGTARIWDAHTGNQVKVIPADKSNWIAVAWSPLAGRLAWHGYSEHTVHVWQGPPYHEIMALQHPTNVEKIAWSADGLQLLSIDRHGALRLWNAATGALVRRTKDIGELVDVSFDAAWSPTTPDLAAVLDGTIVVWNTQTGALRGQPLRAPVVAIAWSPDGRWLAAGGYDGSVRLLEPSR